jgi:threonine dehydrogenase-like Zn-dependent dehydrogenase
LFANGTASFDDAGVKFCTSSTKFSTTETVPPYAKRVPVEQLTIVGVGLIGGSVGLAAKARGFAQRVVGVGRDDRNLARAQANGAIDSYTTNLAEAVSSADLIVVCTPVDRVAADVLATARAAPAHALITDVGSTKGKIVRELATELSNTGATFIGSHPLAGSEKRGSANSNAELFQNRLVIVTPTATTDPEAIAVVELFWHKIGARVIHHKPLTTCGGKWPGRDDTTRLVTAHGGWLPRHNTNCGRRSRTLGGHFRGQPSGCFAGC